MNVTSTSGVPSQSLPYKGYCSLDPLKILCKGNHTGCVLCCVPLLPLSHTLVTSSKSWHLAALPSFLSSMFYCINIPPCFIPWYAVWNLSYFEHPFMLFWPRVYPTPRNTCFSLLFILGNIPFSYWIVSIVCIFGDHSFVGSTHGECFLSLCLCLPPLLDLCF